jgi:filamentous hemagglutinin family protein
MNQNCYRLVFSRRLGMRVAVAEHARGAMSHAPGAVLLLGAALASAAATAQTSTRPPVVFASKQPTSAFALPQPVSSLFRDPAGRGAATVTSGSGTVGGWSLSADGKTAVFDQGSAERVLLNWQSFDIAQGYTVRFLQDKDPARYVSALNRVWGQAPSVIQGQLIADREVILVNPNGVHFGATARVQAGKFVASALSVPDSVNVRGVRNVIDGSAVFTAAGTDHKATDLNAAVTLEAGAEVSTAAGGDVLLVAPRVVNQGRISTPDGQTVLAAGDKVYLMSSSDPKQRGLIVAVDAFNGADGQPDTTLGLAENSRGTGVLAAQLNQIRAERGSVNLVGLSVRQLGQVNATTAVKGANGTVLLQAMATTTTLAAEGSGQAPARGLSIEAGSRVRVGEMLGRVEFGAGSATEVLPERSGNTQLDAEVFNRSVIRAEGASISVGADARITAPAGEITFKAARSTTGDPLFDSEQRGTGRADGSRIVIAPGAQVSAAGLTDVAVDGARNQGVQRLFRIELADAPVQRAGPLYRSQVFFDLRDGADIGSADVGGAAASVARTAAEKSTSGGTIRLLTNGALLVGGDALLDVSGGSVRYGETVIRNSLLAADGHVLGFSTLPAGVRADGLLPQTQNVAVPAYTEGADGGTLVLSGREVALAGQARGTVTVGEYQRDQRSTPPQAATLALGEGSGTSYYLAGIALRATQIPVLPSGLFSDAVGADLSGLSTTASLSLAQLAQGGFGNVDLRAGQVTQPEFGHIDLGVRGRLDITALSVALDGSFTTAGGRIAVNTEGAGLPGEITLSGATRLNTAGLWTNDTAAGGGQASAVQTGGGSVSLRAGFALTAEPGAVVDVSGGGRLSAAGALSTGKAGSATLSVQLGSLIAEPTMHIDGLLLRGYDFAAGGSLALTAPAVTVGGAGSATGITLAPEWFSAGGFGRIAVTGGDLRVAAGARLAPRLLNWQWADGVRSAASGAMAELVATPVAIDTRLADRAPVSLSLAAGRPLNDSFGGGSVSVERGAQVLLEPGAALSLSATLGIDVGVNGGSAGQGSALSAPGGAITLAITGRRGGAAAADPLGFVPEQAIWLGNDAHLAVDGVAMLRPDATTPARFEFAAPRESATPPGQRQTGRVLGGGSITLAASRGYVVAEAGSSLSLDGAAATLNLPGVAAAARVAQAAGTLSVSSPEGIAIDGQVSAQAPRDTAGRALADGGRLQMSLAVGGAEAANEGQQAYPDGPRVLAVGSADGQVSGSGATWGSDLAATLGNGTAWLRSSTLREAGFGGLELAAGQAVRFENSLSLALPLGLQLNAPVIAAAPQTQVTVNTGHALLGDASVSRLGAPVLASATADASPQRDTGLSVQARTLDLVGNLGLQGFSRVALAASGEIRLSALAPNFDDIGTRLRQLNFAGDLQLSASQMYATSGSQYTLAGHGDLSRIVFRGATAGASALPPLTAFGSLTVQATDIEQGGVLRQPFGQITLAATRSLTLGAGSVTSVSGEGATVIYGQTVNLADWQLPGPVGLNRAGDAERKGITLAAEHIVTDAGATVSAGGGGRVQAWEFFKGVGGSTDHYADEGVYAVLPDYAGIAALPVTGGMFGMAEATRQIVITMPGSGLAPGRYTLLPARYALLGTGLPQGAFLVSRSADQGRTTLRAPVANEDGSVVLSGYTTRSGAVTEGLPGERFVVEAQPTFAAKSDVRLTDISGLRQARAASLGEAEPALPRDGGLVQIKAGEGGATWTAALDLAARGGRAGQLDVTATRVALLHDIASMPPGGLGGGGSFSIGADVLARSGAGSVLLGGTRSQAADGGWKIDASGTQQVSVDLGTQTLRLEELLLASAGSVTLAPGSALSAPAAGTLGARTLQMQGDGALLAVSANALELQRSSAALTAGQLVLGRGSVLSAPQVLMDATHTLALPDNLRFDAPSLALGAPRLALGDMVDAAATVLSGALLDGVRAASALSLRGYESIGFAGSQDWTAQVATRLLLDAPVIRGRDGAQVRIAAQDIIVRNSSGNAAGDGQEGAGTLQLLAQPPLRYGVTGGLVLGPGEVTLAFDNSVLNSQGDIVLQGRGKTLAQQDLSLAAARLTATTGAEQALVAGGTLSLQAVDGAHTLGERVGQGAQLHLQGQTVDIGGQIELPGGRLAVLAAGMGSDAAAVTLRAGARLATTGFALSDAAGFVTAGAAGAIDISAALGRIELAGTLDVSAAGQGDAGAVRLAAHGDGGALALASSAQIKGVAGQDSGDRGGQLAVDVARLTSGDALVAAAGAGGFAQSLALRVRTGDVALDTSLRAARIEIAADEGSLTVGARSATTLDARAAGGGVVQLAAGADLVLGAGARIDAGGAGAGGDVLLASTQGQVRLDAGAQVDAGAGRVVLRALRGADGRSVQVAPLNSGQLHAAEVAVEAVRVYEGVSTLAASGDDEVTLSQQRLRSDNEAFMRHRAAVLAQLGGVPGVDLRAGVEVRSDGDLSVSDDWNLAAVPPPGGSPGFLSLRAAGNLHIDASISDGFTTLAGGLLNDRAGSWSYRFSAGADLTGAHPLAVQDVSAGDDASRGLLMLGGFGGRVVVRTGAGSIALAAGRDIVFAPGDDGSPAQVYSAGRKIEGLAQLQAQLFSGFAIKPQFTEQGGRVELSALHDIVSAEATQWVGNWLWRSASVGADGQYTVFGQGAWWTQFDRYAQSLGAFGGGSITVRAGNDIVNLQAMAPSSGWADKRQAAAAEVHAVGGGSIDVRAGRDLLGGQFLLGAGIGRIDAGRAMAAAPDNITLGAPVLGLMDGQWRLSARTGVTLGTLLHPTAAPASLSDNRVGLSGYFYTWGRDAGLNIVSNSGDVLLPEAPSESAAQALNVDDQGVQALGALPPSLAITAAAGDIRGRSDIVLFPSAQGQLRLWAGGSVVFDTASRLAMSDSNPALWPSLQQPMNRNALVGSVSALLPNTLDDTLALSGLHADDLEPVRIHADGMLAIRGATAAGPTLSLAKAATLTAGLDIVELSLRTQHLRSTDLSLIDAGRNLLAGENGRIEVVGPGALEVSAGQAVDLGTSAGITTSGNLRNAALPAAGASVRVAAATAGSLDLDVLRAKWLSAPADGGSERYQRYRDLLLQTVRDALKAPTLSEEEALAAFAGFPAAAQAAFGKRLLAAEFRAVYLDGPAPTEAGVAASLRSAFDAHKAQLLRVGQEALAGGSVLTLPGRETLQGERLAAYLAQLQDLSFDDLDIDAAVRSRLASLSAVRAAGQNVGEPGSRSFELWRREAGERLITTAGAAAANFGRGALPMRLALFDQGFNAAELGGIGSFVGQPIWPSSGSNTLVGYTGTLDMTQSGIVTQRGGDISLINPGGGINVGLKDAAQGSLAPKGVIALGGGNIFGYARNDFQVNTQRVFVVGSGNMDIWSSVGDIDSGRGANTAVAAPPLAPRRSTDGVVFEVPATTTGSGLGILDDAQGRRNGTIGLYPAFGEILALDAFIRAPALIVAAPVKGADNLVSTSISGAGLQIAAPSVAVTPPAATTAEARAGSEAAASRAGAEARGRSSLLTVELLGLGGTDGEASRCRDADRGTAGLVPADCGTADKSARPRPAPNTAP